MSLLRFLCMNVHGGRSLDGRRDLGRIRALMDKLDVDIGVFQEIETRRSQGGSPQDVSFLAGPNRPFRLTGPSYLESDGWYGNLIVSRYEILRGFVHNLETSPRLEPRNAVDVLIRTPHAHVRVIGTHLSLSLKERRAEALNLLRLAEAVERDPGHPLFLMGDINEWQWPSPLLRHLNEVLIPLPAQRTFPSLCPLFRLDRVWHDTPGLRAQARALTGRHVRVLSDHLPLFVEVTDFGKERNNSPLPGVGTRSKAGIAS
jgi:endonuclease/exonuclease/phosphatase family metal-dependent hydrolase